MITYLPPNEMSSKLQPQTLPSQQSVHRFWGACHLIMPSVSISNAVYSTNECKKDLTTAANFSG